MGVAIAAAALDRGARVTLVAANLEVAPPDGAVVVHVGSTAELRTALHRLTHAEGGGPGFDALVMAAAVADFRPTATAERKLERGAGLTLELEPTPDVLGQIARIVHGTDRTGDVTYEPVVPRPVLVGFAAETGSLDRAADKLRRKGVDLLVANDVAEAGSGFGTETNRVSILDADGGRDDLPMLSKREVADRLLDRVVGLLDARDAIAQTDRKQPTHAEPA
jgi:phosphopantothenoylcysteine decarboxylase/phosphopantothenate--cysteine ligase